MVRSGCRAGIVSQRVAGLPDALYHQRRGTTDSEAIFLTLLANGLDRNPLEAWRATLARIGAQEQDRPVRVTSVFSDGETLWALRWASDNKAPTLYISDPFPGGGRALASEPLCGDATRWQALPCDTLCALDKDGKQHRYPLETLRLAG